MENNNTFAGFTNLYSLSKTLRFELVPVGETMEHINNSEHNMLQVDEDLAEKYKHAKKIIDEYHKDFICKNLSLFIFPINELIAYEEIYQKLKKDKKNNQLKDQLIEIQNKLRKQVADVLQKDNYLYKKEGEKARFIKELLPKWLDENFEKMDKFIDSKIVIQNFKDWTSYFGGFNDNRKNIYTEKDYSTSVGFRLVHDNFPKFIENIDRYRKAISLGIDFSEVEKKFNVKLDEIFSLSYFNKCLTQEGIDKYNLIKGGKNTSVNDKEIGINEIINLHSQQLQHKLKDLKDEGKKELKSLIKQVRACKIEELYKQILSDFGEISFRLENINNDGELCRQIEYLFDVDESGSLLGKQEVVDEETGEITSKYFNIGKIVKSVVQHLKDANPEQLYIKNKSSRAITDISQHLFGNYSVISKSLEFYATQIFLSVHENKKETKRQKEEQEKWLNNVPYYSFADIHTALEVYFAQFSDAELEEESNEDEQGITKAMKKIALSKPLFGYFENFSISKKNDETNKFERICLHENIQNSFKLVKNVLVEFRDEEGEVLKNKIKKEVLYIKSYLDSIMDLYHFLKPLQMQLSKKDEEKQIEIFEKDNSFYGEFDVVFNILSQIVPLYNQTRNHLTKKPFNIEKYKLNFDHKKLLEGFTDSHTDSSDNATQYGAYLFRKKHNHYDAYEYYLGISKDSGLFRCHLQNDISENDKSKYERLEYYQPKGATFFSDEYSKNKVKIMNLILQKTKKHFDKLIQSNEQNHYEDFFVKLKKAETPNKQIEFISKHKEFCHILLEDETIELFGEVIDEMKKYASKYIERNPQLSEVKDKKYFGHTGFEDIVSDLQEIAKKNRVFNYFNVSENEFNEVCNRKVKPLLLFKITNKDLRYFDSAADGKRKKQGAKNLHTLYFEQLFSASQQVIDIGKGEIFHRKKTPNFDPIVHLKNEPIVCRTYFKDGKALTLGNDIYNELNYFFNGKLKESDLTDSAKRLKDIVKVSKFEYDILKDKRYTEDKFLFHLSIALNFSKPSSFSKFNEEVNKYLKNNPDVNILGIDRGERHLAYYTLINQRGEILQDEYGNYLQDSMNNPNGKKDYHDLLDKREEERDKARKSWGTIEKIKDMKEGYLSHVVHEIATLMVKYNAIVVFEDLNFGFKKGRFKVEKQVYQKLEKMLIDKLNYLVFKNVSHNETGGTLKAYQLTAPFESFKKLGTQTGFVFYVRADYTSKIDPLTGFVNLIYTQYETIFKSQEFYKKFKSIKYNVKENYFEFVIENYTAFNPKAEGIKQDWIICTYGKRLENYIVPENKKWDTRREPVDLTNELKVLLNSRGIKFENGECFKECIYQQDDSRFFKELMRLLKLTLQMRNSRINSNEDWMISPIKNEKGEFFDSRNASKTLPENADANGAYNIARKGIMVLNKIKAAKDLKKPDLLITNKEWLQFAQKEKI